MIGFHNLPSRFEGESDTISQWLLNCAEEYSVVVGHLSYTCVDEAEIQELNKKFLDHDYPTDILSFGYSEGKLIDGEVVLCPSVIKENAYLFNTSFNDEFMRVLVHGLLHFVGFNDASTEERNEMRVEEEKCLLLRPKKLKYSDL